MAESTGMGPGPHLHAGSVEWRREGGTLRGFLQGLGSMLGCEGSVGFRWEDGLCTRPHAPRVLLRRFLAQSPAEGRGLSRATPGRTVDTGGTRDGPLTQRQSTLRPAGALRRCPGTKSSAQWGSANSLSLLDSIPLEFAPENPHEASADRRKEKKKDRKGKAGPEQAAIALGTEPKMKACGHPRWRGGHSGMIRSLEPAVFSPHGVRTPFREPPTLVAGGARDSNNTVSLRAAKKARRLGAEGQPKCQGSSSWGQLRWLRRWYLCARVWGGP